MLFNPKWETETSISRWLALLRSGRYGKCKSKLHDPATGGYCALGIWGLANSITVTEYDLMVDDKYAGFKPAIGMLGEALCNMVIHWNDSGDKSFAEIADLVEREMTVRKEAQDRREEEMRKVFVKECVMDGVS